MMRSLWTAASGMTSQQLNVDTISNNLANVNTAGYKKERAEFKTLLYETMQQASADPANPQGRPVNLQVGHGVKPIAVSRMFTVGNMQKTDHKLDFAIEGPGFFVIRKFNDELGYTKDGTFKISISGDNYTLVTSEGYQVLGVDGEPITIPVDVKIADLIVAENGELGYMAANNEIVQLDTQFDIVQFVNEQGLLGKGSNLLHETPASGLPVKESDGTVTTQSKIVQGSIELSNVQVANEMVELIIAQRAYDLNSKAIQTSDDMLSTANNLKRG